MRTITPSLLRACPPRLAERLYYRFLCGRCSSSVLGTERIGDLRGLPNISMRVVAGDVISDAIFWTGVYEAAATREIRRIASTDGGLMIDVGANIGYFTHLWLGSNPSNQVLAVEASPDNVQLLKKNLAANRCDDRCRVIDMAVSSEAGEVSFDLGPRQQTGWGGISEGVGTGSRVIRVATERLDRLAEATMPVRLLKVDVEGAEALVFEGASELLRQRAVQEVWFEDNVPRREALGIEEDRLTRELVSHGYTIERKADDPSLPMDIVARAPAA